MLLERASDLLGWPARAEVLKPAGAGPRLVASAAQQKIGGAISRLLGGVQLNVGVLLCARAAGDSTDAPVAIVCELPSVVSEETLREVHRLAWNFCKTPLLITLDPTFVKAWSCSIAPSPDALALQPTPEIIDARVEWNTAQAAAKVQPLHWAVLASENFLDRYRLKFSSDGRADQLLLENLRFIRNRLTDLCLRQEVSHDLLGRIMFIQFLFQRKDSDGRAALNPDFLNRLFEERILRQRYTTIPDLLRQYDDAYAFFHWLNEKFNGDLFPGKAESARQRESEWQTEISQVKPAHLNNLADFIAGDMVMQNGQRSLFPMYSFDTIPLEFISSIYEEFVSSDADSVGAHYTPGYLVDLILDRVLPWSDDHWNVRVLDPSCGSGIFLVKAYQRLIHRWKNANRSKEITPAILRQILERNLFGVDKNPLAVRVASFSLYLAMCDEIDPRYYWTQVRFPRLRDITLCNGDLFGDGGASLTASGLKVDLIVGNAPWGKGTATPEAKKWAKQNNWPVPYNSIGPLFLPKAVELGTRNATITMLQPLGLIMNRVSPAAEFRRKLFLECEVESVVNLAALRFGLFKEATGPACVITLRAGHTNQGHVTYICPKPAHNASDDYRVSVDVYDVSQLSSDEAATDEWIWSTLAWGGRRDLNLVRRLGSSSTLEFYKNKNIAVTRQGVIRGDRRATNPQIVGKPFLSELPENTFLYLDAGDLPVNHDPKTHSRDSQDLSAFELPQLLVKQAWRKGRSRFQAVLVRDRNNGKGVLCSKSFLSVHMPSQDEALLERACLTLNSSVAVYFLLMTSGRFASYRPEANVEDLLRVPLVPETYPLPPINSVSELDEQVMNAFDLKSSERALVQDVLTYTLPDFKGGFTSPGREKTQRATSANTEPELQLYCEWFLRVLQSGFGNSRLGATIYTDSLGDPLPVRAVAIHLNAAEQGIRTVRLADTDLLRRWRHRDRIAHVYDVISVDGKPVPTVYILKPDQRRYWTRSVAMRDADEVALDVLQWNPSPEPTNVKVFAKA